ncbi:DUF4214 domain-containing protein [Methylocystis echinoides]|uniref:Hemolysin-type calcium-binding region n=1 Tax=Methylocystis echinoides TaxID=29468 RepID=A0A9W6LRJ6_9HYPH|nr:DUF4214 domain-containing protein [Methylocystis echinoides]GLI92675.1 hemolysin-type calcium-binding region [Methylocystis echinoides]
MAAPLPTVQQAIDGLYIVLYGRTADSLGYTAWSSYLGLTQTQIAAQQATAAQYQSLANAFITGEPTYYNATYPSTMTNTQFVNALYVNLGGALGDAAGTLYWTSLLNAGQSRASVVAQFTQSFQSIDLSSQAGSGLSAEDYAAAVLRQKTFNNKVIVSQYYAQLSATNPFMVANTTTDPAFQAVQKILQGVDATPASVAAAQAVIDAAVAAGSVTPILNAPTAPGQNFNLTVNTDMIVGTAGNDTITAGIDTDAFGGELSTFTTGDQIDGGAGRDTLKIYASFPGAPVNMFYPSLASVRNVETIDIYNANGALFMTQGKGVIDASKFVGATLIRQIGDAAGIVELAATTTAAFKDIGANRLLDVDPADAATRVSIAYENIGENGTLTIGALNALMGRTFSLNSVTITGAVVDSDNDGTIANTNVAVTVGQDVEALTFDSAIAANLTITDGAGTKKLATIDASASKGAITYADTETTVATIRTGAGDDTVTLVTATSKTVGAVVDASVSTGDGKDTVTVNVTGDGKTSVSTGAGDDTVDIAARDMNVLNVNLGDGADTFTSTATINATDVIDAGAGVDVLALKLVGAANIGAFRNFDVYDVKGMSANLDLDILNGSNTVTEIVGSGALAAGVTLQNVGAGVNFRVTGSMGVGPQLVLTQKTAGALTITLDADQVTEINGDEWAATAVAATNANSISAVFDTDHLNPAGTQTGEASASDNAVFMLLTEGAATSLSVVSGGAFAQNNLYVQAMNDTLTNVTVTGARSLFLNINAVSASKIGMIDASAQTGGLTASLALLKDGGVIKLGSGTDVITANAASNATAPESIQGFAKTAAVAVSTAPADATARAAAIAAADKLVISGADVANASVSGAAATLSNGVLTFTGAGPTTLDAALRIADDFAETAGETVAFQFIGDTYVFAQGATHAVGAPAVSAADTLVKLVGVTGVTSLVETGADQFFVV